MKITQQSVFNQKNQAGFVFAKPSVDMSQSVTQLGFQNAVSALDTLQQWRVQEEEIRKLQVTWPSEKFPLQILIQPHPQPDSCLLSVKEMFSVLKQWEAACPGFIRFELMAFPLQRADVVIQWQSETTLGRDFEVGHTNRKTHGKRIQQVEITLIDHPIIDGHLSPEKQKKRLQATLLHEMGHALGLEHSEQAQDVMFYRGWQRPYLSANDILRAKQLYAHSVFPF